MLALRESVLGETQIQLTPLSLYIFHHWCCEEQCGILRHTAKETADEKPTDLPQQ